MRTIKFSRVMIYFKRILFALVIIPLVFVVLFLCVSTFPLGCLIYYIITGKAKLGGCVYWFFELIDYVKEKLLKL